MGEDEIRERLVEAIRGSGRLPARIAEEAGVHKSILSRLLSGERGLSLSSTIALAKALDLELVLWPKPRRKGR